MLSLLGIHMAENKTFFSFIRNASLETIFSTPFEYTALLESYFLHSDIFSLKRQFFFVFCIQNYPEFIIIKIQPVKRRESYYFQGTNVLKCSN